jgi:hypothetical protein
MIKTKKIKKKLSNQLTLPSQMYQKISHLLIRSIPHIPSSERYNITICHKEKFLWFRVAKVGTRTIFDVFDQAQLDLDAEHPMFCHYPTRVYKEYFKFAFVRNPWDRLVSCWQNKVVGENYFRFSDDRLLAMQTFRNFVDFVGNQNIEQCDHHIRLQQKLIDLNSVDFIGRFENFNADLEKVIKIIGIKSTTINHSNRSANRFDYREYYDAHLKEKVAGIYHKDINIFKYEF